MLDPVDFKVRGFMLQHMLEDMTNNSWLCFYFHWGQEMWDTVWNFFKKILSCEQQSGYHFMDILQWYDKSLIKLNIKIYKNCLHVIIGINKCWGFFKFCNKLALIYINKFTLIKTQLKWLRRSVHLGSQFHLRRS